MEIKKKIINNTNECIDSCEKSNQYKYEYNGKCYDHCPNRFLYDNNNNQINKCKCELDKCLTCPNFDSMRLISTMSHLENLISTYSHPENLIWKTLIWKMSHLENF